MDSSNELPVDRHQTRADHVVALARRHAEEIRAAAEQEAERLVGEAEQRADGVRHAAAQLAHDVRREAEEQADRVRREAEEHADRVRREAEEQADRVQREAEQHAERVRLEADQQAARRNQERIEAQHRAEGVRHEAEQQALRVRREAEQQADRVRREAEQHAERVRLEAEQETARRLEADRRERVRIGVQRSALEGCLDATSTNLAQIRELIAVLPDINSEVPPESQALPVSMAMTTDSKGSKPGISPRLLNSVAIILGTWSLVMVLTLLVMRSAGDETSTVQSEQGPAAAATPAPAEAEPAPQPAAQAAPAVTEVAKISTSQESGLTIAFVASQDCWLSIASDDGAPSERMLRASERYVVHARDAVTFKAGNAGALSVLINDQPTGPLGSEGRTVTRRITRANYKSFLQS